jgi:hypothetical protein
MFSKLSKSQRIVVAENIRDSKSPVSLKIKAWADLHEDLNLGRVEDTKLYLVASKRGQLKTLLEKEYGPLDDIIEGKTVDRIEASGNQENEKDGTFGPTEFELRIKSHNNTVCINQQRYNFPDHGSIIIDINRIKTVEHNAIVVIENLEAFKRWHSVNFDVTLRSLLADAIVIYRGHNKALKCSGQFCEEFGQSKPVYVASDLDPAGINIALTTPRVSAVLWPSNQIFEIEDKGSDKLFDKHSQYNASNDRALQKTPDTTKAYYDQFSKNAKGYIQEFMIEKQLEFSAFILTAQDKKNTKQ